MTSNKTIGWLVHTSSSSCRGAAKGVAPGDASCSARGVISTSAGGRRGVPFGSFTGGGAAPAGQSGGTDGGGATAIGSSGAGSARGGHVAGAEGAGGAAGAQRPVAAGTTVGEGGFVIGGGDRETTRVGLAASGDGCRGGPPLDGGLEVAKAAAALVQAGGTVGGAATKCGEARAARTSSRSNRLNTSGSSTHSTS